MLLCTNVYFKCMIRKYLFLCFIAVQRHDVAEERSAGESKHVIMNHGKLAI